VRGRVRAQSSVARENLSARALWRLTVAQRCLAAPGRPPRHRAHRAPDARWPRSKQSVSRSAAPGFGRPRCETAVTSSHEWSARVRELLSPPAFESPRAEALEEIPVALPASSRIVLAPATAHAHGRRSSERHGAAYHSRRDGHPTKFGPPPGGVIGVGLTARDGTDRYPLAPTPPLPRAHERTPFEPDRENSEDHDTHCPSAH